MPDLPPNLSLQGSRASPQGRSAVAARSIAPGAVVACFGAPSIAIPDSAHMRTVCNYCLLPPRPVKACTGCRTAAYCSTACQKADWALAHSKECRIFKKVTAEGHDSLPTPVRALVQVLLRVDLQAAAADVEAHTERFRRQPKVYADMELQALAALHYLGREPSARSVSGAVDILCKLQVNSFNRLDVDIGQNGLFFSPALAMVNHSCVPNAFVQFIGRKAFLRAYQTIEKDDEVTISYIDCTTHLSHRQQSLKERYHFDCKCPRCEDDLDVYQVCQAYPHLDMNTFSLSPGVTTLKNPPLEQPFHSNKPLQRTVQEIYPVCSQPLPGSGSLVASAESLLQRWNMCKPLREAKLFAIEPLPQVLAEASILLGEQGKFAASLAISCFLALNSDPYKCPAPFSAQRMKGLLMIAKLLSNIGATMSSDNQAHVGTVGARLVQTLNQMDHATIAQAVLTVFVRYGPKAHSEQWQVYQEGSQLLMDIESLPGRAKERGLIKSWAEDPDDAEGKLFFDFAVLKPFRELAGLVPEIMDSEFASRQRLIGT